LYYLTFILLCTAPLSYGWGAIANPDDMMMMIWSLSSSSTCCRSVTFHATLQGPTSSADHSAEVRAYASGV